MESLPTVIVQEGFGMICEPVGGCYMSSDQEATHSAFQDACKPQNHLSMTKWAMTITWL